MEENLFPSMLSVNTRSELEEERRLFYVALTRAEKKVFLTYAASRYKWGNLTYSQPSRFIDEIDAAWLDKPEVKEQPKKRKRIKPSLLKKQLNLQLSSPSLSLKRK